MSRFKIRLVESHTSQVSFLQSFKKVNTSVWFIVHNLEVLV